MILQKTWNCVTKGPVSFGCVRNKDILILLLCSLFLGTPMFFYSLGHAQQTMRLTKIKEFNDYYRGYFSSDGLKLALLAETEIQIVKVPTGGHICKILNPGDPSSLRTFDSAGFAPDGKVLAANYYSHDEKNLTVTQEVILFNATTCKEISRLKSLPSGDIGDYLSFSSDGKLVAASAEASRVWTIADGREIYKNVPADGYTVKNTLLSPDGKWLVSHAESFVPPNRFHKLFIDDLYRRTEILLNSDRILYFQFTSDSKELITMSNKASKPGLIVTAYEVGTWKMIREFSASGISRAADISPDSTLIAGGGDAGTFKIVSLKTGDVLAEQYHYKRSRLDDLAGNMQMISFLTHVEFSPDGKMLATGGEDGSVKLWKLNH